MLEGNHSGAIIKRHIAVCSADQTIQRYGKGEFLFGITGTPGNSFGNGQVATMNFLTEHGIGSYEELEERCDAVAAASIRTRESLRDMEQRITDLVLLGKQIDTYRKLNPVYDRYKASKDKEKFLRGFESEIILFEAAAREIKKAGLAKLPSSDKLKAELDGLSARKTALQTELRKIQREETEYDTLRQNVDALLERPKE